MLTGTLLTPTTVYIGLSMIGMIVLGLIILVLGKDIVNATKPHLKTAATWLFSFNGIFWTANIACMAYSAQNAGYIFGLYETSGYAVGIIIDLLIIAFTQVMMTAMARGERDRAAKILLFIVACCVLSLVGNVAHNLHVSETLVKGGDLKGVWFDSLIPYVASVMPLFLIGLAWVKDLKVDPLEFDDPKAYEAAEKKRIQYRQTQVKSRQEKARLEAQLIAIEKMEKQNKLLRKGKLPKSFRWPWEQPLAIEEVVAQIAAKLHVDYEKMEALEAKVCELQSELERAKVSVKEDEKDAQTLPQNELNNAQTSGPDTDPALLNVSPNFPQTSEQTLQKDDDNVGSTLGQTSAQTSQNFQQNFTQTSGKDTDKLSLNSGKSSGSTSTKVLNKVTRKLSPELLKTFEEESEKSDAPKRNVFSKVEAAHYLKCSVKEVEVAIDKGQLKTYGNSKDKVLVSSLKNYTPAKKRRMKVVA